MPYKDMNKQREYDRKRKGKSRNSLYPEREDPLMICIREFIMLKWVINEVKEGRKVSFAIEEEKERELGLQYKNMNELFLLI